MNRDVLFDDVCVMNCLKVYALIKNAQYMNLKSFDSLFHQIVGAMSGGILRPPVIMLTLQSTVSDLITVSECKIRVGYNIATIC